MKKFMVHIHPHGHWRIEAESMRMEGGAFVFTKAKVNETNYETVTLSLDRHPAVWELSDDATEIAIPTPSGG